MKLILSRKGFDSSSGGCPNPILPDGRLCPLPIPDTDSVVRYKQLSFDELNVGTLVSQLTKGRVKPSHGAHLDPDLLVETYPRLNGWKPVLGQHGAAQGHLRNMQVDVGDLFLFFGLFRPVERYQRKWRFVPNVLPVHALWGWMRVTEKVPVTDATARERPWLAYHPHFHFSKDDSQNMLYLSELNPSSPVMGAGVFPRFNSALRLTKSDSRKPSVWTLPKFFFPGDRESISYHSKQERWTLLKDSCVLESVARGQEFVLDLDHYPAVENWVEELISSES